MAPPHHSPSAASHHFTDPEAGRSPPPPSPKQGWGAIILTGCPAGPTPTSFSMGHGQASVFEEGFQGALAPPLLCSLLTVMKTRSMLALPPEDTGE